MFAVAPLLFWAWLHNESPLSTKDDVEKNAPEVVNKNKKFRQLTADQAIEIMLDHGFLPQLPAMHIPALIISVQGSRNSNFQGINLKDLKKPVLLHFWATWCGPCKRELPFFAAFVRSQDAFIAYTITSELNNDSSIADRIWNFYNNNNINGLNVCADTNGKLASLLGVNGIPATFIISSEGLLLGRFLGATDWASPDLAAALVAYVK